MLRTSSAATIVVLSGRADSELALAAVGRGAQDYLPKGRLDGRTLMLSLRYALARQQVTAVERAAAVEWETTFNTMSDPVCVLDPDGDVNDFPGTDRF